MNLFSPSVKVATPMSRAWCMPSADTFSMRPVAALLTRWLADCAVIVDPFARNSAMATLTNDLNPNTTAQEHLPAEEWCELLIARGVVADAVLFDPPYSPRQISDCYAIAGRKAKQADTQNARIMKLCQDALTKVLKPAGIAISFGWNSRGFGVTRGFSIEEILLVAHGGAHNDTICVVERKAGAA